MKLALGADHEMLSSRDLPSDLVLDLADVSATSTDNGVEVGMWFQILLTTNTYDIPVLTVFDKIAVSVTHD